MIDTKNDIEIQYMREGGQKLGAIRNTLMDTAREGVNLLTIESMAQKLILDVGGKPSFPTVEGYKWATCLCINDEVVHGIPHEYSLQVGDVFTLDIGMIYKGFHTDTADTKIIGKYESGTLKYIEKAKFLDTGRLALKKAIEQAIDGNRVGHISQTIQDIIEGAGYSIVKTLVGHGVGRFLHEDPQIPGYVRAQIENTPRLNNGMTIAIEVIYAAGKGAIVYTNDDGWTIGMKDGSLSAVFEHSVAITSKGPLVLTAA